MDNTIPGVTGTMENIAARLDYQYENNDQKVPMSSLAQAAIVQYEQMMLENNVRATKRQKRLARYYRWHRTRLPGDI
jgi:hypothetical protein